MYIKGDSLTITNRTSPSIKFCDAFQPSALTSRHVRNSPRTLDMYTIYLERPVNKLMGWPVRAWVNSWIRSYFYITNFLLLLRLIIFNVTLQDNEVHWIYHPSNLILTYYHPKKPISNSLYKIHWIILSFLFCLQPCTHIQLSPW